MLLQKHHTYGMNNKSNGCLINQEKREELSKISEQKEL